MKLEVWVYPPPSAAWYSPYKPFPPTNTSFRKLGLDKSGRELLLGPMLASL